LAEEKLEEFGEGDVRELVRNSWAFRIWTNTDYLVDEILSDGIAHVRETLRRGIYEAETRAEKYDVLESGLRMYGPANASELLTFLFPDRCAIFNNRGKRGLEALGFDDIPNDLHSGDEYDAYCDRIDNLLERLRQLDGISRPPRDFLDVDWFLYYLSETEAGRPRESESTSDSADDDDFDHDAVQNKLLTIGDGLGFDVEEEYGAGPGARIDVRWKTRIANLGVISYTFEVHRRGSRDSAILNLQKTKNADPSVQRLVVVSNAEQIEKFKSEIEAISSDFAETVSYMDVDRVDRAVELIGELKDILEAANLMSDF